MFVLHVHWQPPAGPGEPGRVLFWAETSEGPGPARKRGRAGSVSRARPHPFCADPAQVGRLLAPLPAAAPLPGHADTVTLLLPSTDRGPRPSPQLIHEWALDESTPVALAAWVVPALALPDSEAFDILACLPLSSDPRPDLALAADARYWHVAASVVLEALAGQKLAPVLVEARGAPQTGGSRSGAARSGGARPSYEARWLAVLDSPQDAARLARIEAAMPPICRAEIGDSRLEIRQSPISNLQSPTPHVLLDSFIQAMADGAARRSAVRVFEREMAAPIAGAAGLATRLAAVQPPAGRWLRALFGDDPHVEGSPAQLAALHRSIRAWLRNLHVAGAGDLRVAFRLEPPKGDGGREKSESGVVEEWGSASLSPSGGEPGAKARSREKQGSSSPAPLHSSTPWRLRYLLQGRSDPSLLVPAEEVWKPGSEVLKRLGRRVERPQENLLAALGYAARLYPPVARSLRTARPEELALSGMEAYDFLREAAPLLEQSGFGVLVPPWWNQRGSRLGLRLKARPRTSSADQVAGRLSFQQLVEFQWQMAVGDTALSRQEFEALVALKSPLVQVRGQWVQLDPAQIEAALRFYQAKQWQGETSLLGALQLAAGQGAPLPGEEPGAAGLPVERIEFEGWLAEWMERLRDHEKVTPLPQPAGLRGQLRPYQIYGYSWLEFLRRYGISPILADDMGLGKTVQTIAVLQRDKEQGNYANPVLLICPTSVVGNWQREVRRFAPDLTTWVHQGHERLRGDELVEAASRHDLVLTSYPLARRDAESLGAVEWRGVILDEAQNIKNPEAQQTQAIRRLPAGFRMALTGTPVENRLSELWSIMQFLNPGYLGSRERFRRDFAIPIERYNEEEAGRRLRSLVGPLILRRVKTDPRVIQDLPDKLEMKVYCNLSEEQASLYEAVVQESLAQVEQAEGIDRRGQVLAMLMKLKQVCDHPALFLHQAAPTARGQPGQAAAGPNLAGRSGKLDRLAEMLEEALAAGDRALIFTQFAEMGQALHAYLPAALGRPALFLHGGVPASQRDQMVARFQSADGPPIFILSLKAGGVGLNLTQANHVFHFDRWWNPAVEDQATDRAFRIGQTRNVQVHKFVSVGTLEEMIDDMIESKRALAQAIVGAGENWLTELSTDQLRDLVTLRPSSVG